MKDQGEKINFIKDEIKKLNERTKAKAKAKATAKATSKKTATKKIVSKKATTKKGEKKMGKTTVPDFMKNFKMVPGMLIGNRDAKVWMYGTLKSRAARPAIKEVKGVKAVEAKKAVKAVKEKVANTGRVIQEAVKAQAAIKEVKGVKAVEAKEAIEGLPTRYQGFAIGNTPEILNEMIARIADQGFYPDNEGAHQPIDEVKFSAHYTMEDVKGFRSAVKLAKGPGKYNEVGLAKKKAEEKGVAAKKKAEGKAAADKKKAAEKKAGEENDANLSGDKTEGGWPKS